MYLLDNARTRKPELFNFFLDVFEFFVLVFFNGLSLFPLSEFSAKSIIVSCESDSSIFNVSLIIIAIF